MAAAAATAATAAAAAAAGDTDPEKIGAKLAPFVQTPERFRKRSMQNDCFVKYYLLFVGLLLLCFFCLDIHMFLCVYRMCTLPNKSVKSTGPSVR